MAKPAGGPLLGRRSYAQMLGHWHAQSGPYRDSLNSTPKYVASSTSGTRLDWPNSTLLHGDVPAAVAELGVPLGTYEPASYANAAAPPLRCPSETNGPAPRR